MTPMFLEELFSLINDDGGGGGGDDGDDDSNIIQFEFSFHSPYHILCWGFPILLGIIPFSADSYGRAGLWW